VIRVVCPNYLRAMAACAAIGCGTPQIGHGFSTEVSNIDSGAAEPAEGGPGPIFIPEAGPGLSVPVTAPNGPFGDFPVAPVIDAADGGPGVPSGAPSLFAGASGASPGPCLVEPENNSLFPHNWLRPRVRYLPQAGQNLFEIRIHTANETSDLVAYTSASSWTVPKAIWDALCAHVFGQPLTVTVRGAVFDGTKLASPVSAPSTATLTIAPADASGSIVYWSIMGGLNGATALKGFKAGDESVVTALLPAQVQMPTTGGQVTCVGCHTSTPDGLFAGFTAQDPWGNAIASVQAGSVGQAPSFLGAGAVTALRGSPIGIQAFSRAHWATGDHIEVAPLGRGLQSQLAWFDLEATSATQGTAYDFVARTGDTMGVAAPSWSHDGASIVYMSTDAEEDGQPGMGQSDLYAVPYNGKKGGAAAPVSGAATTTYNEYYPAFSADDQFIAFDRIASGMDMYNQPAAEVYVIPSVGGMATRLAANDPPTCAGKASPGITNSWPKWSPEATTISGKTYYWLIFSSTRNETGNPQLYLTGAVVESGKVSTYAAIYLWNQPADENNHTPAWDVFKIPPVPIVR
jgi:hypothetical protein